MKTFIRKNAVLILCVITLICVVCFASCGANGKYSPNEENGKTNTQEKEVDEGDISKMFGDRIYNLQSDGLTVTKVDDGLLSVIGYFPINKSGYYPKELYVANDRVLIIGRISKSYNGYNDYAYREEINMGFAKTLVYVISLKNINGTKRVDLTDDVEYSFEVDGDFVASRMYTETKEFYLASSVSVSESYNSGDITGDIESASTVKYITYKENGKNVVTNNVHDILSGEQLGENEQVREEETATVFLKLDLLEEKINSTFVGCYGAKLYDLYMSVNGIYPNFTKGMRETEKRGSGCGFYYNSYNYNKYVYVAKFEAEKLELVHINRFNNYVITDRYAVKDYGDYVFVTVRKTDGSGTTVVSFDGTTFSYLNKLEKIAPGEEVKSVAYDEVDGKRYCYITTYRNTDPLFKVDITNPVQMQTLSALKISGYSTYMYPVGDRLISIGYGGTQTSARADILRVSLFNSEGDILVPYDTYEIQNTEYCEALKNPRALAVLGGGYFGFSCTYYSSLYRLNVTEYFIFYTDGEELQLVGTVSESNNNNYFQAVNYNDKLVRRAFEYNGYLYTVANKLIISYKVDITEKSVSDFVQGINTSTSGDFATIHHHILDQGTETQKANCQNVGIVEYRCTVEGCDYTEETITDVYHIDENGDNKCDLCGWEHKHSYGAIMYNVNEDYIKYGIDKVISVHYPTCEEDGYKVYKCEGVFYDFEQHKFVNGECNEYKKVVFAKKHGHKDTNHDNICDECSKYLNIEK